MSADLHTLVVISTQCSSQYRNTDAKGEDVELQKKIMSSQMKEVRGVDVGQKIAAGNCGEVYKGAMLVSSIRI